MRTAEIFCGTKSFTKVAAARGHHTFTLDNDPVFGADETADVLTWTPPGRVAHLDLLWLSPPCQGFSVMNIGKNWYHDHTPKTDTARLAMRLVARTLEIVEMTKPRYWVIENPRAKLRKLPMMQPDELSRRFGTPVTRHTVTYCQYGDTRAKPTDLWTNIPASVWTPKPTCKYGAPCHVGAPRGSRTAGSTQGLVGAERGAIPPALFHEIFDAIENMK
jgi:hypothetical protein